MMRDSESACTAGDLCGPSRRSTVRRYAIERLLDWGFDPTTIALLVGCNAEVIKTFTDCGAGKSAREGEQNRESHGH